MIKFDPILSAVREADTGTPGADGLGVPAGGTTDQVLAKASDADNDTEWVTPTGGSGAVDSVNTQTGVVVLDQDDIADGTTYKQFSATEKIKLSGIETGADVTDTTNVTSAGALMDSEVTNLSAVKSFDPTDYALALGTDDNYVTDAEKANLHAPGSDDQDLSGYLTSATAASTYEPLKGSDDNFVTDAEKANLHAPGSDNQDLSGLVPYTGATGDVTLGTNRKLTAGVLYGNNSTSSSPGIIVEGGRANMLYKTTGTTGGVAFNIIKATVENTTPLEAQWGAVGFYGTANLGIGDPICNYMYFDARTNGAYNVAMMKISEVGMLVGSTSTNVPSAKLEVTQPGNSGALPVMKLSQIDLSEQFIDFEGTVGASNPISTAAAGSYYGKVRVSVNGTFKWMHLFN